MYECEHVYVVRKTVAGCVCGGGGGGVQANIQEKLKIRLKMNWKKMGLFIMMSQVCS